MGRQQRVVVGGQATQQLQGTQQHLQGMQLQEKVAQEQEPQEKQLQGQQGMLLWKQLQQKRLQEPTLQEEQQQ